MTEHIVKTIINGVVVDTMRVLLTKDQVRRLENDKNFVVE